MKPLDIKCPWCFAAAGSPCGDIGIGRWIGEYHHDRCFITLQQLADAKGKAVGDLTIDMKPRTEFIWFESSI